jgi:hypothetical protein
MIRQLAKASVLPDVHLSRTPNHTRIIAEYHSFLLFNLQKKKAGDAARSLCHAALCHYQLPLAIQH